MLLVDGYDECFVGIICQFGRPDIACYDMTDMIDLMVERDGMTEDDAWEHFHFNILGAYMGDDTPCFMSLGSSSLALIRDGDFYSGDELPVWA